jgi:hypothetical protein
MISDLQRLPSDFGSGNKFNDNVLPNILKVVSTLQLAVDRRRNQPHLN